MKKNIKTIHFMGIEGSGIAGVAKLASKMGYIVTGCDLQSGGHNINHLKNIDLLIVTPAVFYQNSNNPELIEGKKRGIIVTWQEFLGKYLAKNKKIIAVAGTHGKSTTTTMVGKLLEDNNFDPLVVIGAKVPEWKGSSRFGKGEYFVIEADEFYDNFLNYHPEIAIINNIEFDHPDYFKNEKQLQESFRKFTKNLIGTKKLITEKDSLNLKFNLKVIGLHNQKNANMAFLVGKYLKIPKNKIIESLESFNGIGRRLELIGEENNIKVYDDYAHHPTAIEATLEALKNNNPKSKIWAIVEPHGYNRTHTLLKLYDNAFKNADKVIIGPIFKARDTITFGITPKIIASKTNFNGAIGVNSIDEIIKIINREIKSGDTILVMGAGNSNLWAREILMSLKQENIAFKDLTTLKIGGKIGLYKEVKNKKELIEAIKFGNKLPIFVIGSGSNILVNDCDYDGLVIKYVGNKIKINGTKITAEAGVIWDKLVETAVINNLQGLESLSGIPGTLGAAPVQNIGAYRQELSDTFLKLTAYDIRKNKFVEFNKSDCKFGYRKSFFKKNENFQKYIITDVTFKLKEAKNINVKKVRLDTIKIRNEKLENPNLIPNAGSFFMNPFISVAKKIELEKKYPDMIFYPVGDKFKISAAFLIEKSGWKGRGIGNVKMSDKHALILTNPEGKGNFDDVKKLANEIIKDVNNKFKIKLEPEVQYINI